MLCCTAVINTWKGVPMIGTRHRARTQIVVGVFGAIALGAGILLPGPAEAATHQETFILAAVGPATATHDQYDVPTSVTIAQAALESSWGGSSLTVNDRNYFGFKCVSASDPGPIATGCHNYPTVECTPTCHTVNAYFRVYASQTDSFRDYGRLLSTSSIYADALPYRQSPDAFIRKVAVHYATDPDYANKVISIMQTYNLYQYDTARVARVFGVGAAYAGDTHQYHVTAVSPSTGALFQNTYSGSWSGWQNLGGVLAGTPAITYRSGRYDVFGIGSDGAVYQRYWSNGTWSTWYDLGGGPFTGGVTAVYASDTGQYHVLAVSKNTGAVYRKVFANGAWSTWQNLGGVVTGTPAITYHVGRFDVFGIGTDGAAYQKYWSNGNWSAWYNLGGGPFTGGVAAVYASDTKQNHVLAVSKNTGAVYRKVFANGAWSGWQNLGGVLVSSPAITYHDGFYHIYGIGSSGAVYQKYWNNGTWSAWTSIGGDFVQ
jgi:hypothetical protein